MAKVIHTCNVVYGSYSQNDVKITVDEDDDMDVIKARIRRIYDLNFLSMATYTVKITNTKLVNENEYED